MKNVSPTPGPSVGLRASTPVNVSVTYWMMASWSTSPEGYRHQAHSRPGAITRPPAIAPSIRRHPGYQTARPLRRAPAPEQLGHRAVPEGMRDVQSTVGVDSLLRVDDGENSRPGGVPRPAGSKSRAPRTRTPPPFASEAASWALRRAKS